MCLKPYETLSHHRPHDALLQVVKYLKILTNSKCLKMMTKVKTFPSDQADQLDLTVLRKRNPIEISVNSVH
jgi:hypothetical protein